ncbi:hypothetical protein TNCV_3725111 [Trichonephila clavipes]|nr:hypothetical protein TNCV_3725111 [Trichonephila clavipes]
MSAHGTQTHKCLIGVDLTIALSGPSRMHRRQTARSHIWKLCPPHRHSSLKQFPHHPPKSQSPQSDRPL